LNLRESLDEIHALLKLEVSFGTSELPLITLKCTCGSLTLPLNALSFQESSCIYLKLDKCLTCNFSKNRHFFSSLIITSFYIQRITHRHSLILKGYHVLIMFNRVKF